MGDDDVYDAEKIVSSRVHNGKTLYLVKWKGYSQRESTWEPVENILEPSLLTAFENSRTKKSRRGQSNSSRTRHTNKNSDDRENSISSQPATTSKVEAVTSTASPTRSDHSTTSRSATPTIPKSPVANLRSPSATPSSPAIPKSSPTTSGSQSKIILSPTPTNTTPALRPTPPPNNSKIVPYSPSSANTSTVVTAAASPPKVTEIQVKPLIHSPVTVALPRPVTNGSPRITSTPLPMNDTNSTINNNNSSKNRRLSSRFAILNTVITDVTVNDQTITISESKTNQGFFREVSRNSVAVDTTHPGESMDID